MFISFTLFRIGYEQGSSINMMTRLHDSKICIWLAERRDISCAANRGFYTTGVGGKGDGTWH